MWIFVFMELVVFVAALIAALVLRARNPEAYATAQAALDGGLATLNTIVLVSSGALVAWAVERADAGRAAPARRALWAGATLGWVFLGIKGAEYAAKIAAGHTPGVSGFLDLYWALTGFHAAHVIFGIGLLLWGASRLGRPDPGFEPDLGLKTIGAFWHMCDLIWVLLLPTLYLL
ncbi:MAG: cytochrome c oxidase subunit 3 [Myxococcales bacterium]|nr:cytochrome c oxidase subunit 3 [Myxococcales bacterium]